MIKQKLLGLACPSGEQNCFKDWAKVHSTKVSAIAVLRDVGAHVKPAGI